MQKRITVVARLKPLPNETDSSERCVHLASPTALEFSSPTAGSLPFSFDAVFPDSMQQKEVVERICGVTAPSHSDTPGVESVLDQVLRGINATILCYGQTGSGKTYTMMGTEEFPGIIPTLARELFRNFARILSEGEKVSDNPTTTSSFPATTTEITVKVSFIEIYREKLFDLLANTGDASSTVTSLSSPSSASFASSSSSSTNYTSSSSATSRLRIREENGKIVMEGAVERYISDAVELLAVFTSGLGNRSVGSTLMNQDSSRSHSVFSMVVERTTRSLSTSSKLQLVDLAGSEMVKRTGASGERLEEAKSINQSLSSLGNVILALCDEKPHVPYRDSKLTRILQDALGGSASTVLVLNLSQACEDASETLSTLRFGQRAKRVKNVVVANVRRSVEELERLLEAANRRIRELTTGRSSVVAVAEEEGVDAASSHEETKREAEEEEDEEEAQETIQTLRNEIEDLRATLERQREAGRDWAKRLQASETENAVLRSQFEQTRLKCDLLKRDLEAAATGGNETRPRRRNASGESSSSSSPRRRKPRSLSFPLDAPRSRTRTEVGEEEEDENEEGESRVIIPSSSTSSSSSKATADHTATLILRERDVAILTEKCIQYQVELTERQEELEYLRLNNVAGTQDWRRMKRSDEEAKTARAQLEAERRRGEVLHRKLGVMQTQLENRQEHLDLFESVVRDFQEDFKAKMTAANEREVELRREVDRLNAALRAAIEVSSAASSSAIGAAVTSSSSLAPGFLMKKPVNDDDEEEEGEDDDDDRLIPTRSNAIVPFTLNNLRADIRDLKCLPERVFPFPSHSAPVRVRQRYDPADGRGGTELGFGNAVYPAALYLCDFLSRNPGLLASKRVIELGAGSGVVSLALSSIEPATLRPLLPIVCTDGDEDSLQLARENVELNGAGGSVVVRKLLWGAMKEEDEFGGDCFDAVVASDVVAVPYASALDSLLLTLVHFARKNPALVIYITHLARGAVEEAFFAKMGEVFSECGVVAEGVGEDFRDSDVKLWRFAGFHAAL